MAVGNQVLAPFVMAASIATLGGVGAAKNGAKAVVETAKVTAKTLTVGGKVMKFATKTGKLLVKAVNGLKKIGKDALKIVKTKIKSTKVGSKINQGYQWGQKTFKVGKHATKLPGDAKLVRRMYHMRAGTNWKKAKMVKKTAQAAYQAVDEYTTAFAADFIGQTSKEINAAIDEHFKPFTAEFIKRSWAMDQLTEMAEANAWGIAQTALTVASIVDPSGVFGVVEAYAKPKCQDHVKLPCPPKVTLKC